MIVNVLAAVPLAAALLLIASIAYDAARDWALRRTARHHAEIVRWQQSEQATLAEIHRLRDLEAMRLSDEEWDRQLAEAEAESNIVAFPPRLRSIDRDGAA